MLEMFDVFSSGIQKIIGEFDEAVEPEKDGGGEEEQPEVDGADLDVDEIMDHGSDHKAPNGYDKRQQDRPIHNQLESIVEKFSEYNCFRFSFITFYRFDQKSLSIAHFVGQDQSFKTSHRQAWLNL